MNKQLIFITILTTFVISSFSSNAAGNVQDDPVKVVKAIFTAAKPGNFSLLSGLCDPTGNGDGDTKTLCSMRDQPQSTKDEFRSYFKKGRVTGKAIIKGDGAKVKIKFGPDGTKDEEFRLIRLEGKWYIVSY